MFRRVSDNAGSVFGASREMQALIRVLLAEHPHGGLVPKAAVERALRDVRAIEVTDAGENYLLKVVDA